MWKFVALLMVLSAGIALSATAATSPTLRVVKREPLIVHGSHFRAYERVRVSYGAAIRRTTATAVGGFSVTFTADDRCTGGIVRAVGAAGDRAAVKLPQPLCPPP